MPDTQDCLSIYPTVPPFIRLYICHHVALLSYLWRMSMSYVCETPLIMQRSQPGLFWYHIIICCNGGVKNKTQDRKDLPKTYESKENECFSSFVLKCVEMSWNIFFLKQRILLPRRRPYRRRRLQLPPLQQRTGGRRNAETRSSIS